MAIRDHIASPDCWCKPKVTENGSQRSIHHRDVEPPKREAKQ